MNIEDAYRELDERVKSLEQEIEERYKLILDARDKEILSFKMDNEALRRELDMVWKRSVESLAVEKMKVRDLEERWGKLLQSGKSK